jgi:hypothetical protein
VERSESGNAEGLYTSTEIGDGSVAVAHADAVRARRRFVRPTPFTFRVVPLDGPGTKGPSELDPQSDPALAHVAAYLRAHPAVRVRLEGMVSAYKTSSGPNAALGAHRADLVARELVARGVPCERLEVVGVVDHDEDGAAERIRVLVDTDKTAAGGARVDSCREP